jgi:hypothetical protein
MQSILADSIHPSSSLPPRAHSVEYNVVVAQRALSAMHCMRKWCFLDAFLNAWLEEVVDVGDK